MFIQTFIAFTKKFDTRCTHERYCTKWCFDRIYRQCRRLNEAIKAVYADDKNEILEKRMDRRKQFIENWQNTNQNIEKPVTFEGF